ncbi:MAG: ATP-dependent DNA helicase, partial [Ornithinibacter sp.]
GADAASPAPAERPVAEAPPPPDSSRTAVTRGHAWTQQEDEELRDGVELGLSLDELSESMELAAEVVSARLSGLGLEAGNGPTLTFG